MATFRDWRTTLRKASYRGAPFFVDTDKLSTGRRLVVHEFPNSDQPYVEDLGRDANKFSVTAYVLGDDSDSSAKRLLTACEARGAAALVLPLERYAAHCEKAERSFHKDKMGYIALELSFVREGVGSAPFPTAFLGYLIAAAITEVRAPIAAALALVYRGIGIPSAVADASIGTLGALSATLSAIVTTHPLATAALPPINLAIAAIREDAAELARAGDVGDQIETRSGLALSESVSVEPLVAAVFDTVVAIGRLAAPDVAIGIGMDLVEWVPEEQADARARDNVAAIATVARIAALCAVADGLQRERYRDRRAAIQARANAAELFTAELERLAGWRDHAVYVALETLSNRCAEHLTQQIATLAPVVIVESNLRMPALWWANRLYGDANRATELVERNRAIHAGFLPLVVEALAA